MSRSRRIVAQPSAVQHGHGGVVAAEPADGAAADRTRAAQQDRGARSPRPSARPGVVGRGVVGEPRPVAGRRGRCGRRAGRAPPRGRAGVITSRHGRPSASRARQSSSGSASTACSDRSAARRARSRAPSGSARNRPTGVCRPNSGQRVDTRRARSVGAEDRRVGERVAVDLARQRVGDPPGLGLLVRLLQLARSPGRGAGCRRNRSRGSRPERSRGSRRTTMLILIWLPTGDRRRLCPAAGPGSPGRSWPARCRPIDARRPASVTARRHRPASGRESGDRRAGAQLGPGCGRGPDPAPPPPRPCRRPGPATRRCRCRSRGTGSNGSAAASGRARR